METALMYKKKKQKKMQVNIKIAESNIIEQSILNNLSEQQKSIIQQCFQYFISSRSLDENNKLSTIVSQFKRIQNQILKVVQFRCRLQSKREISKIKHEQFLKNCKLIDIIQQRQQTINILAQKNKQIDNKYLTLYASYCDIEIQYRKLKQGLQSAKNYDQSKNQLSLSRHSVNSNNGQTKIKRNQLKQIRKQLISIKSFAQQSFDQINNQKLNKSINNLNIDDKQNEDKILIFTQNNAKQTYLIKSELYQSLQYSSNKYQQSQQNLIQNLCRSIEQWKNTATKLRKQITSLTCIKNKNEKQQNEYNNSNRLMIERLQHEIVKINSQKQYIQNQLGNVKILHLQSINKHNQQKSQLKNQFQSKVILKEQQINNLRLMLSTSYNNESNQMAKLKVQFQRQYQYKQSILNSSQQENQRLKQMISNMQARSRNSQEIQQMNDQISHMKQKIQTLQNQKVLLNSLMKKMKRQHKQTVQSNNTYFKQINQLKDQLKNQLKDQIKDPLIQQLNYQLKEQSNYQLKDHVINSLKDKLKGQVQTSKRQMDSLHNAIQILQKQNQLIKKQSQQYKEAIQINMEHHMLKQQKYLIQILQIEDKLQYQSKHRVANKPLDYKDDQMLIEQQIRWKSIHQEVDQLIAIITNEIII